MALKTRSLENLEQKMEGLDRNSLRYRILESVKQFKTSWVELGQALYSVWKDKLYKEWGYATFDAYTSKEIGIKKQTAMKLLRSYYFLEKEEPGYLKKDTAESTPAAVAPTLESVNVLRMAKSKKMLGEGEYEDFRKAVFEKGKDAGELKKDLTALIRERKELEPEEARAQRRQATIKRFLSVMRSLKQEIETSKLLPASVIKDAELLIKRIESQML